MKYLNKFNESKSTWSNTKKILKDIYSEINPILKIKKMKKYHIDLKSEVEQLEKELEEKKKTVQKLEKDISNRVK